MNSVLEESRQRRDTLGELIADWIRERVSFSAVIALLALFASGVTYVNQVRALDLRVSALEQAVLPARLAAERQDATLEFIRQQLVEIKDDLKDIKRRQ